LTKTYQPANFLKNIIFLALFYLLSCADSLIIHPAGVLLHIIKIVLFRISGMSFHLPTLISLSSDTTIISNIVQSLLYSSWDNMS